MSPEAPRMLREAISEPLESKSKEELIKLVQAAREDEEWFRQRYGAAQGTVRALEGYRAQWNAAHVQDAPRTLRELAAKVIELEWMVENTWGDKRWSEAMDNLRAALAAATPEQLCPECYGTRKHRNMTQGDSPQECANTFHAALAADTPPEKTLRHVGCCPVCGDRGWFKHDGEKIKCLQCRSEAAATPHELEQHDKEVIEQRDCEWAVGLAQAGSIARAHGAKGRLHIEITAATPASTPEEFAKHFEAGKWLTYSWPMPLWSPKEIAAELRALAAQRDRQGQE